jgi:predicted small secreted protein
MKKLFAILAFASVVTACNNSTEGKEAAADTLNTESPLMDAKNISDSAGKLIEAGKDSVGNMMEAVKDSTGKAVEKAAEAVKH